MSRSLNLDGLVKSIGEEMAGLSLAVANRDGLIYQGAWGRRQIRPGGDKPMKPDTLCRIASISKTVCALSALILKERDELDFDRDLSDYLGFHLGNPRFPGQKITAGHIFTHTSSLRDGTSYNLPKEQPISSILSGIPSLPNWSPSSGPDAACFDYCNLGYGVMATVMEKITGQTYDKLAARLVLDPLLAALKQEEITYSRALFNIQELTGEERANLATLYRKQNGNEIWQAQFDSPEGVEAMQKNPELYSKYTPGTNGTLFSPQGGLRTSALTLSGLGRLFLGRGRIRGIQVVPSAAVSAMLTEHWRFDPAKEPESSYEEMSFGFVRSSGYGIFRIKNDRDKWGSDSLLPQGGPECWIHHADAYGLKGGLLFDMDRGLTFTYLITGTAEDHEKKRGKWSHYSLMEESLMAAVVREFWD